MVNDENDDDDDNDGCESGWTDAQFTDGGCRPLPPLNRCPAVGSALSGGTSTADGIDVDAVADDGRCVDAKLHVDCGRRDVNIDNDGNHSPPGLGTATATIAGGQTAVVTRPTSDSTAQSSRHRSETRSFNVGRTLTDKRIRHAIQPRRRRLDAARCTSVNSTIDKLQEAADD